MRILIQRVTKASVTVESKVSAAIENGLLVFAGIEDADTMEDIKWLSNKIVNLRIFDDENNADSNRQLNISVREIEGEILLVSQFTLHATTKKR